MHLIGPVHVNFPFVPRSSPIFAGADLQAMQRAAHDCFALGARNVQYRREGWCPSRSGPALLALPAHCPFQHRGHRAIVSGPL